VCGIKRKDCDENTIKSLGAKDSRRQITTRENTRKSTGAKAPRRQIATRESRRSAPGAGGIFATTYKK